MDCLKIKTESIERTGMRKRKDDTELNELPESNKKLKVSQQATVVLEDCKKVLSPHNKSVNVFSIEKLLPVNSRANKGCNVTQTANFNANKDLYASSSKLQSSVVTVSQSSNTNLVPHHSSKLTHSDNDGSSKIYISDIKPAKPSPILSSQQTVSADDPSRSAHIKDQPDVSSHIHVVSAPSSSTICKTSAAKPTFTTVSMNQIYKTEKGISISVEKDRHSGSSFCKDFKEGSFQSFSYNVADKLGKRGTGGVPLKAPYRLNARRDGIMLHLSWCYTCQDIEGFMMIESKDGEDWSGCRVASKSARSLSLAYFFNDEKIDWYIGICSYKPDMLSPPAKFHLGKLSHPAMFESVLLNIPVDQFKGQCYVERNGEDFDVSNVQKMMKLMKTPNTLSMHPVALADSPFYNTLFSPLYCVPLPMTGKGHQVVIYDFFVDEILSTILHASQENLLKNTSLRVMIRMCEVINATKMQDDKIPDCIISVNSKVALVQLQNKYKGYLDLTERCKFNKYAPSVNKIRVDWYPKLQCDYCLTLSFVKVLDANEALAKLKQRCVRPAAKTTKMIQVELQSDNWSEITYTSLKIPLKCPLSKSRIVTPCRGSNCTHIFCMDAFTLLKMNESRAANNKICFMCDKPLDYLYVDGLFVDILHNAPDTVNEVEFKIDGSWNFVYESAYCGLPSHPVSGSNAKPQKLPATNVCWSFGKEDENPSTAVDKKQMEENKYSVADNACPEGVPYDDSDVIDISDDFVINVVKEEDKMDFFEGIDIKQDVSEDSAKQTGDGITDREVKKESVDQIAGQSEHSTENSRVDDSNDVSSNCNDEDADVVVVAELFKKEKANKEKEIVLEGISLEMAISRLLKQVKESNQKES